MSPRCLQLLNRPRHGALADAPTCCDWCKHGNISICARQNVRTQTTNTLVVHSRTHDRQWRSAVAGTIPARGNFSFWHRRLSRANLLTPCRGTSVNIHGTEPLIAEVDEAEDLQSFVTRALLPLQVE